MMRWMYATVAWILFAAVIVQFFLAGLGVFVGPQNFAVHAMFGGVILLGALIAVVLSFVARMPWRLIGLSALLPVLVVMQAVLVALGAAVAPALAALHPVNGLLIFSLSGALALRATRYARSMAAQGKRACQGNVALGRAATAR
jgi:hypothetical protein